MALSFNAVYQFKITLEGISPAVWRIIQVPASATFWDLSVAIQAAMGWEGHHRHEFFVPDPASGISRHLGISTGEENGELLISWEEPIAAWFKGHNPRAEYLYDLHDQWRHQVECEEIRPRQLGVTYPCCIDGRRRCPPEDCGGAECYSWFLDAWSDPDHHPELRHLLGPDFDPEHFSPDEVYFNDPLQSLSTFLANWQG